MRVTDVCFHLTPGVRIPVDHGYAWYAAISGIMPCLHAQNAFGLHTIEGKYTGNRSLTTNERSALIVRAPLDSTSELSGLSERRVSIHGIELRIGSSWNRPLQLAQVLHSRLVTTKNGSDAQRFQLEVKRQLQVLRVSSHAVINVGKRRTVCIKNREIVGYELTLINLTDIESLKIQEFGIGGRRKMGCGVFNDYCKQISRRIAS